MLLFRLRYVCCDIKTSELCCCSDWNNAKAEARSTPGSGLKIHFNFGGNKHYLVGTGSLESDEMLLSYGEWKCTQAGGGAGIAVASPGVRRLPVLGAWDASVVLSRKCMPVPNHSITLLTGFGMVGETYSGGRIHVVSEEAGPCNQYWLRHKL